jgi:hypothetical protein
MVFWVNNAARLATAGRLSKKQNISFGFLGLSVAGAFSPAHFETLPQKRDYNLLPAARYPPP